MKKFSQIILKLILIFTLLSAGISEINPVKAETADPLATSDLCYSLDVVFLVDQSGSMSTGETNDPTEQRKHAVDSIIDYLADISLDKCVNVAHRIAVVSFGTNVDVNIEKGEIQADTIAQSIAIRDKLKGSVRAYNLNKTNMLDAFLKAIDIFENVLTPESISKEYGPRKRVIIFITDGMPYPIPGGDWKKFIYELKKNYIDPKLPFDKNLALREQCLNELIFKYEKLSSAPADEVNICLSKYSVNENSYNKSTYIYGLFLRSSDVYVKDYLTAWNTIFESHAGEGIVLSRNLKDIPDTLRQLIAKLASVNVSVVKCGSFAVDPYLKRAVLTFFKIDPDLKVTLSYKDAKGDIHSLTGGQPGLNGGFDFAEKPITDEVNERYVINNPYPGIWNLSADNCDGLDAYYDPVQIRTGSYQPNLPAEIPQYELAPYYDDHNPYYLDYQIKDIEGVIIPQADDPVFKVQISVNITQPDGVVETYPMSFISKEELFRTNSPIKVPIPGVYRVDMTGKYYIHSGNTITVSTTNNSEVYTTEKTLFEEKGLEFKVHPVSPFAFDITKPTNGEKLGTVHGTIFQGWPLPINPVKVSVLFSDPSGKPIMLSDILDDPNQPLEAMLESDGKSSASIKLSVDPANPNLYSGSIPGYDIEGTQDLKVNLTSKFNEYYRPLQYELTATITREDGLFNRPTTYILILSVLCLLLVIRIVLWALGQKNKLGGYLLVKMNGTVVRVLNINSGHNSTIFGAGYWAGGAQTCIRSLRIFGAKNPPIDQKNEDENGLTTDTPPGKVKVRGSKSCNRKGFGFGLTSGYDTPVCDEDGCTIMYLDINQASNFSDDIASADNAPARINILSILSVVIHVGLIAWLLILMLF